MTKASTSAAPTTATAETIHTQRALRFIGSAAA
jgi:hypothetical protein